MLMPPSFPVLETIPYDQKNLRSLSPFTVSIPNGFLPTSPPPESLPAEFSALTRILERMPIRTAAGTPGLLASSKLGETVLADLPDLTDEIEKYKADLSITGALYRDYSFLASAYLLEPCHERYQRGEGYGLGRQRLPACLARPLARVAEISGFKPFMEYAGSYALFNWRREDPSKGMQYDNLRLIRAFEYGLDPQSSEAGFVLVHVDMVKHSGELVEAALNVLSAGNNRAQFDKGLDGVVRALSKVNQVMDDMWKKSKPNDYNSFRTFIFGITKQSMFPDGVVYEGVSEEPLSFRGESGANDSMIPLCDNLLEIGMPDTPLTEILQDFRSYRPGNHRKFLEWVKDSAEKARVKDFALKERASAVLYVKALKQVCDFRWRHWCFTREYILKKSSHATATGGSPIVRWLPNQLFSVLEQVIAVDHMYNGLSECEDIVDQVVLRQGALRKEVRKYCAERE